MTLAGAAVLYLAITLIGQSANGPPARGGAAGGGGHDAGHREPLYPRQTLAQQR